MAKESSFFDRYFNYGIAPVSFMLARFICTQYGKKEDSALFYFIITLSLLFDRGHIRVAVDEIISELEILQHSSINESEKEFYTQLIDSVINPVKIIEDNSDIFLPVSLVEEKKIKKRAPYILLEDGKQISTEKLYFEEKRFVENFLAYLNFNKDDKKTAKNKYLNKEKIFSAISSIEKYSSIKLEEKQKEAVVKSFADKFLIISGGPGTGKTTVIKTIIETHLLIDNSLSGMIAVAAPTGKAARRLEAVLGNIVAEGKVKKPQTVHTLLQLGYRDRDSFLLLPYRMIIIDESSMLDLKMISELMKMVHPGCSLLMVGDPQQLPAVGAGTLFSDITDNIENNRHLLHHNYVSLERVKRAHGSIAEFAENIRKGIFSEQDFKNDNNIKLAAPEWDTLFSFAVEKYKKLFSCAKEGNREMMLDAISSFVLLAPYNYGLFGVKNLNQQLASYFSEGKKLFFQGLPIMITKNDYNNGLYNGDRGVIIYDNSIYYAIFKTADGALRQISASLLKEWEISYAQTVHKSQGNEYDSVAIVAAVETEQPKIVTREVLYTAVTRAKKEIIIFSKDNIIKEILKRKVLRNSGIKEIMLNYI